MKKLKQMNVKQIFIPGNRKCLLITALLMLIAAPAFTQTNIRPNVPVPGGFEVNSYTGNLYYSRTDLQLPVQGMNIDITFSFNTSRRTKDWGLGKGWTFTYNMAYTPDSLGIFIERADGKRDFFRKVNNFYEPPLGVYDSLVEFQSGKFYLRNKSGTRYFFENSGHKKLTKIQDLNNNSISLQYTDTLLTNLSDASGKSIRFTWTAGRLTAVTDSNCAPVRTVSYAYDTTGNMYKVTNPMGFYKIYYYDAAGKLKGMTDENGFNYSIVYKASSAVDKVVSCATTHQFTFVAQQFKSYVTETVNGQRVITTYQFDTSGKVIEKNGNCCGYNVKYEYDSKNNITRTKDGKNNLIQYIYDGRGNIVKETDQSGNFTTYTYNALNNKIATRTDKNNNSTSYQYDVHGNLLQVNKPLGISETYVYDNNGRNTAFTDGRANTTTYQYNTAGNLTQITDAENGNTLFAYDCRGNRTAQTDPMGNVTLYEYNAMNQLSKRTDPSGGITSYTYDGAGNVKTMTNQLGKITTYEYDGLNRRIKTIAPSGSITQLVYDEQNNIIKRTDANGNVTVYSYNNRKQVLSEKDAAGNMAVYDYDEAGNLTAATDKRGGRTGYEYDNGYRVIKKTNPDGGIIRFAYDALGNRISEIDANGNVTLYEYDALQRVVKMTDPQGKYMITSYDANDNHISERDRNGSITYYTYDKLNRLKTTTDAAAGLSTITYDANGNIVTETNQLNFTSLRTYDPLNRILTETNPANETTTWTYDAAGNVKTITQPGGNVTTNVYNSDNRKISQSDLNGIISTYTYDGNGNILTEKDGNNNMLVFVYDALNRRQQVTDPLSHAIQYTYDPLSHILTETDRNGKIKSYAYDIMGHKASETDANGNTTRFTYDANGNRISIRDAKDNITGYSYDALNRLIRETFADGTYRQFTYDANGNQKTRKDNNGIVTTYTYDVLNRLVKRSYPGGIEDVYTYDAANRRLSAINANATISFSYDNAGRLLAEVLNGKTTGFAYNTAARIKTITYPGGRVITEERDFRNRLIAVKENGTTIAGFTYDAANQLLSKILANGYQENYTYNANGWLTALNCQPGNVIAFTFTYDNEGNKLTAVKGHRPTHSEKYLYDNLYRLNGFYNGTIAGNTLTDTTYRSSYTYDALHNRTFSQEDTVVKTYLANKTNAYTSVVTGGVSAGYSYDMNGNITSDGSLTYGYDYENRLTSVNGGATARYFYDAIGRKIRTTNSNDTLNYFYSGTQVVEETDNQNISQRTSVYGIWIDDLVSYKFSDTTFFLVNNLQGSPMLVFKNNILTERIEYNGMGRTNLFNSTYQALQNYVSNNSIGFTGRPQEKNINLYNFRNREYSSVYGRFLQVDQLGYLDGFNLYYPYFVPNNIDPFGTKSCNGFDYSFDNFRKQRKSLLGKFKNWLPFIEDIEVGGVGIEAKYCTEETCCSGKNTSLKSLEGSVGIEIAFSGSTWSKRINLFHSYFDVWLGGHLEGTISGSADIDYKQQCGDNSEASACLGLRGEISLSFGGHIEAVAGRLSLLKAGLEIGGRVGIAAKYCITYNSSEIKHWTTGSEIELENPVLFGSLNIGFFTKSFEWEASKENIDDLLHKVSRYFDW